MNYLERDFGRNRDRRGPGPRRFGRRFETPKPFKIGDVIDLTIESIGEKGDGVGKINGFVIFVKEVKQGETVRVKITAIMRKFAIGEKTEEAVTTVIEEKPKPEPRRRESEEPDDEEEEEEEYEDEEEEEEEF